tara:strand:- start:264 stop:599 length:336 start_codon:yes stop_codon:yes gene_type:complete
MRDPMPKYMYSGNYTEKGAAGLLNDGGKARHEEAERSANAMGGSLEAYYWAYGSMDFFMIVDIPSEAMAIKFSLHVGASGVFNGKLTPLISVDEMEAATSTELPSMRLPGE